MQSKISKYGMLNHDYLISKRFKIPLKMKINLIDFLKMYKNSIKGKTRN